MKNDSNATSNLVRAIKKFFLSAFVVASFVLYALHKPASSSDGKVGLAAPTPTTTSLVMAPTDTTTAPDVAAPTEAAPTEAAPTEAAPTGTTPPQPTEVPPTDTPAASVPNTSAQSGQYRDGTYTGPEVDAIYGLVQVQAIVKGGKISTVQFLEYPNDRRTSVRINNFAMPYLQQEAIQSQSANVDLITGATLTSEAFQESLQAALSKAKGTL